MQASSKTVHKTTNTTDKMDKGDHCLSEGISSWFVAWDEPDRQDCGIKEILSNKNAW